MKQMIGLLKKYRDIKGTTSRIDDLVWKWVFILANYNKYLFALALTVYLVIIVAISVVVVNAIVAALEYFFD